MPCYEPRRDCRESRLIMVCRHLVYLCGRLEININEKIKEFAKREWTISEDEDHRDTLDIFTEHLCDLCKWAEIHSPELIYDGRIKEARALADWWDEHKEIHKEIHREHND